MTRVTDLTGQRFGRLTVLGRAEEKSSWGAVQWRCRCDCGKETLVATGNLKKGTQSCGCLKLRHGAAPVGRHTPYPPMEDCVCYSNKHGGECTALTEVLCATRGSCSFFREKEGKR